MKTALCKTRDQLEMQSGNAHCDSFKIIFLAENSEKQSYAN